MGGVELGDGVNPKERDVDVADDGDEEGVVDADGVRRSCPCRTGMDGAADDGGDHEAGAAAG